MHVLTDRMAYAQIKHYLVIKINSVTAQIVPHSKARFKGNLTPT